MRKSSKSLLSPLIALFLVFSFPLSCLAATLTNQTLKNDLNYYHSTAAKKGLNVNDRYYILLRIEEKYENSGVNLKPLYREMEALKAKNRPADNPARSSSPSTAKGAVTSIEISETGEGSRITVSAAGVHRTNYFLLKDPEPTAVPKIVLDLYGVADALPSAQKSFPVETGIFSSVRAAQFEGAPKNIVRVVAEMRRDAPYRVQAEGDRWTIVAFNREKAAGTATPATAAVIPPAAPALSSDTGTPAVPRENVQPAPKSEDGENYRIEAGDVLGIAVYPADELSREAVVQQDGNISFPLIGSARAKGNTIKKLSSDLEQRLGRYIANPQVTVTVKQFSRRQIFVTGEVKSVGAYNFKENMRLLEFISSIGGFTDQANRKDVRIYRGPATKRQTFTVNVEDIVRSGDFSKDFLLEPADIVEVPKGQARVAILGDVRSPGYYDYKENLHLLEFVSLSGGFTDTADIAKVTIIRPDQTKGGQSNVVSINLKRILAGASPDVPVKSGDTVYIPKKGIASANWFVSNILPWLSLVSLVLVIRGGI